MASAAGMEERPGVMEALAVKTAAAGPPAPQGRPVGGGPHQQPGGAFCHWVTYAVTVVPMQADTAVTVDYTACVSRARIRTQIGSHSLGLGHGTGRGRGHGRRAGLFGRTGHCGRAGRAGRLSGNLGSRRPLPRVPPVTTTTILAAALTTSVGTTALATTIRAALASTGAIATGAAISGCL